MNRRAATKRRTGLAETCPQRRAALRRSDPRGGGGEARRRARLGFPELGHQRHPVRIDPATGSRTPIASGLGVPLYLDLAANGQAYITDDDALTVIRWTLGNGAKATVASGFQSMGGVAAAPDGQLSSSPTSKPRRSSASTRRPARRRPLLGTTHSAPRLPRHPDGQIFVADLGAGAVFRVDPATGRRRPSRPGWARRPDRPPPRSASRSSRTTGARPSTGSILPAVRGRRSPQGEPFSTPTGLDLAPDGRDLRRRQRPTRPGAWALSSASTR